MLHFWVEEKFWAIWNKPEDKKTWSNGPKEREKNWTQGRIFNAHLKKNWVETPNMRENMVGLSIKEKCDKDLETSLANTSWRTWITWLKTSIEDENNNSVWSNFPHINAQNKQLSFFHHVFYIAFHLLRFDWRSFHYVILLHLMVLEHERNQLFT